MFWGTDRFPANATRPYRPPFEGTHVEASRLQLLRIHASMRTQYRLSGSKGDLQTVPLHCFGNFFETTQSIRNVRFGGSSFEPMGNPSTIMPRPMCSDETIQWLMFADAFYQGMSGSFIVAALDIEGAKPRLEDHWREDRSPGFEQVDEGLIG
ncbi:hypothetical protein AK812_SmicGene33163 [Symbiodinium microadriaticum]|uniref:Uncharacterized protein n=1 Tax=Symbiodinium microadriaticum TaxID=2951 RepID=A0A1Q9CSB0_SYMMI|nr:hypothetical protein AK812_SmicGene33163 [Symbiodinium microadriaticum]